MRLLVKFQITVFCVHAQIHSVRLSEYMQAVFTYRYLAVQVDFRFLSNAYNFGIIPKPSTLMKMADYFNVSIDYLLGRSDNDTFSKSDNPVGFYARQNR